MKVEELKKKISEWHLRDFLLLNKEQENTGITFIDGKEPDKKISYAQLYRNSVVLANEIDSKDEDGNGYCIILTQGHKSFIHAFWGIVLSGRKVVISPLLTEPVDIMEMLQKQISSLGDCYIITTPEFMPLIEKMKETNRVININAFTNNTEVVSERKYKINDPKDVSIIQYSSGSMSHPKGVMLSDSNIVNNVYQVINRVKCTEKDTSINYLPLNHALGLLALSIAPMYLETEQYHIETKTMLQNPLILPDRIDKYKATVTASPNIGLKYMLEAMKTVEHKNWDLSSVRVFLLGAEPLSWELISEFFSTMESYGMVKEVAVPAYGMTEAGLAISVPEAGTAPNYIHFKNDTMPGLGEKVVVYDVENEEDITLQIAVSLGYALDELSLRICDEAGNECQNGISGEIQIKGPNVFLGYFNEDENSFTQDNWFKTGDIGTLIDGKLYVFGRLKNMIIANGSNLYLEDIEEGLAKRLGVASGKVAVAKSDALDFENYLSVYFEKDSFGDKSFEDISDETKKIVQSTFGIMVDKVYVVSQLPRTAIGKIARGKLALSNVICVNGESKENNNFKEYLEEKLRGTKEDIKETLITLINEETGTQIDDLDIGFLDAGLDSLKLNLLIEELKEFYPNIKISDLFEASSVNKLGDMLFDLNNKATKPVKKRKNNGEKVAFLFPGQGSLNKESCEKLYRSYEEARKVFDEASEILGHDLINDFKHGQPELVTASIAAFKVLKSYTGITPDYMAGHSLGEYSALCAADVIDLKTALELTRVRENVMAKTEPGIMAAVLGMDQGEVQHFIDEEIKDRRVYCANFNSPKQIVISGAEADVKYAMKELESRGANVVQLRTDSASHCPLMKSAAVEFEQELEKIDLHVEHSEVQIISNVNAESHTSVNIIDNLTNQLTNPVLWSQIVKKLSEQGVGIFIDVGPGEILKKLNSYMDLGKDVKSYSVEADLENIKGLFNKSTSDTNLQLDDFGKLLSKCLRVVICSPCKKDYTNDAYESLISKPVKEMICDYKLYKETGRIPETADSEALVQKTIKIMESKGFSTDYATELLAHTVFI